jgi:CheY-like chemotaxis protein
VTPASPDGLTVLVVEDEFLIAEEMAAMLRDAGHVVLGPAGSVRAAEAMLADDPKPDVAVIDANLRGETSAPLARRLRERGIPFCVCTGYRINDLRSLFGDVVTIRKPIDPALLLRTLAALARDDGT